jgi:hypothetical protein
LFESEVAADELNERIAVSRWLLKSNRLLAADEEVEFIASRSGEMYHVDRLPDSLLDMIVETVSLRIESADWLLDLICGPGSDFESLVLFVGCEFLSWSQTGATIAKFIDTVYVDRINLT